MFALLAFLYVAACVAAIPFYSARANEPRLVTAVANRFEILVDRFVK